MKFSIIGLWALLPLAAPAAVVSTYNCEITSGLLHIAAAALEIHEAKPADNSSWPPQMEFISPGLFKLYNDPASAEPVEIHWHPKAMKNAYMKGKNFSAIFYHGFMGSELSGSFHGFADHDDKGIVCKKVE